MFPDAQMENSGQEALLADLIKRELLAIPIAYWGYFFPCHLAVWRFIEKLFPGILGEPRGGYDREPYFKGKGSHWFCETLGNNPEYLDCLEKLMYPAVDSLTIAAKERGFLIESEVPQLDAAVVRRLSAVVIQDVERGIREGLVK